MFEIAVEWKPRIIGQDGNKRLVSYCLQDCKISASIYMHALMRIYKTTEHPICMSLHGSPTLALHVMGFRIKMRGPGT